MTYTTRFETTPLFSLSSSLSCKGRAIHSPLDTSLWTRRQALHWGCALLLPGCQGLLRKKDHEPEVDIAGKLLQPLPQLRDGIRLDVFRVDRPVGDPRIGESMWKAVSQGGSLDPATIRHLNESGFRFGTVPTSPPLTLQSLYLSTQSSPSERTLYNSFSVPSGEHAILELMQLPEGMKANIPSPEGERPETLHAAKAVLRIRADKIVDGWARIEVVPEIHHGEILNRPVAGEREWLMQNSQRVEPLYQLKFHVELNRGEMAVVGLNDQAKTQIGRWFFRNQVEGPLERVMLIRLADVFSQAGLTS